MCICTYTNILCSHICIHTHTHTNIYMLLFSHLFSHAKWCPTRCDPMDYSMPGFPVLYYLLEFAQTHVHWVSDAIQPSHPLLPSSPPALNLPITNYCKCPHSTFSYYRICKIPSNSESQWFRNRPEIFISILNSFQEQIFSNSPNT